MKKYKSIAIALLLAMLPSALYSQSNNKIQVGKGVTLTAKPSGSSYKYQWQVNMNNGTYVNVEDNDIYVGANKQKLSIAKVSADMNNYTYSCVVNVQYITQHVDTIRTTVTDKKSKKKTTKTTFAIREVLVPDNNNFNEGKIDTLTVVTGINSLQGMILPGDTFTLKSDAPNKSTFQWQSDNGYGFKDIPAAVNKIYTAAADCKDNGRRYRCVVTDNGAELTSKTDTLFIYGCITQFPRDISLGNKTAFTISHKKDSGAIFRWRVDPYNSGSNFIDITVADSDLYGPSYNKDTLVVKSTVPCMNGAVYKCDMFLRNVNDPISGNDTLNISGKIARYDNQSRFQLQGALYSGIQGIKDDNSASLTQIYLRSNIFFRKTQGIDINATGHYRHVWLRNMFLQATYSTNAESMRYVNLADGTFTPQYVASQRGINRLDLLKNADLNVNVMVPVITWIIPSCGAHYGDIAHIYVDPFFGTLRTAVNNKDLKDTTHDFHVNSIQYGVNVGVRFEDLKLNNLPFYFEIQTRVFWISAMDSRINDNMNYQEYDITNAYTPGIAKPLTIARAQPYYNLDGLVIYNTSATSSSNVFLHFSYFANMPNKNADFVYNRYWQIQAGYALDILSFWSKLNPKKS